MNNNTQRQPGFHGGVQVGTSAASNDSKLTESIPYILIQANMAYIETHYHLHWKKRMDAAEIKSRKNPAFKGKNVGMNPDGGFFLDSNENIVLVIECKHQGKVGNACERWDKNAHSAYVMGALRYMTICTGEGFYNENTAERTLGDMSMNFKGQSTTWNDDSPDAFVGNYRYSSLSDEQNKVLHDIFHELDIATAR